MTFFVLPLGSLCVFLQKPVGSSSSSSSITNTSNNYNTNSSSSNINCSSGGSNNNASSSSSSSGGAGEPFSPGRAPQPPPSNVYKGRGGLGGWLGLGWVGASKSQNPPAPYKRSLLQTLTLNLQSNFVGSSGAQALAALKGAPSLHTLTVDVDAWTDSRILR